MATKPTPNPPVPEARTRAATATRRMTGWWRDAPLGTRRLLVSFGFLVALYVGFGLVKPVFLSTDNFWTLSQQGSILLLVALGATFVVMMGMIDLSVGSLVTLSAITLAVAEPHIGTAAVPLAIAVTTGMGMMNGVIVTLFRLPSFLVTLGTLTIIQGIALLIGETYVRFQNDFVDKVSITRVLGDIPIITIWAAVLTLILAWVARYTVFGRGVYAIGGGEKVSQIVGLPIKRYKIAAFGISGFSCAIAGIMLAGLIGAGTPQIGANVLLDAVAAIAVGGTALTGGVGGPWGTVVGASIMTVLSGGLVVVGATEETQNIIKGAVVIGAVYFTMDRARDLIIK